MKKSAEVRIHRFGNKIAISIGDGPTKYVSAAIACDIASALRQFAVDVENTEFVDSNIGTKEIEEPDVFVVEKDGAYWNGREDWISDKRLARRFETKEDAQYSARSINYNNIVSG